MQKIESHADFMNWAACVNHSVQQADLQDVFSRSNEKDLVEMFLAAPKNDKHLLIFSIAKNQGSEAMLNFVKRYADRRACEQIEADWAEVSRRESELAAKEREMDEEVKALTHANITLQSQLDAAQAIRQIADRRLRQIHELEAAVEEMETELNRLRTFEAHVQELLTR